MVQIVLTLVFYLWLIGALVLLFLIWRNSIRHLAYLQSALIDVSNKSAEAAKTAAEAAQKAVALVEKKP